MTRYQVDVACCRGAFDRTALPWLEIYRGTTAKDWEIHFGPWWIVVSITYVSPRDSRNARSTPQYTENGHRDS